MALSDMALERDSVRFHTWVALAEGDEGARLTWTVFCMPPPLSFPAFPFLSFSRPFDFFALSCPRRLRWREDEKARWGGCRWLQERPRASLVMSSHDVTVIHVV